jgi:hypothetical protein
MTRNKPRRKRAVSRARHTPVVATNLLAVITDPKLSHKRRAKVCRWALNANVHRQAAIEALKEIAAAPDASLTDTALDLAMQSIQINSEPGPRSGERIWPDTWVGREMRSIWGGRIDQPKWDAMTDAERFPLCPETDDPPDAAA